MVGGKKEGTWKDVYTPKATRGKDEGGKMRTRDDQWDGKEVLPDEYGLARLERNATGDSEYTYSYTYLTRHSKYPNYISASKTGFSSY